MRQICRYAAIAALFITFICSFADGGDEMTLKKLIDKGMADQLGKKITLKGIVYVHDKSLVPVILKSEGLEIGLYIQPPSTNYLNKEVQVIGRILELEQNSDYSEAKTVLPRQEARKHRFVVDDVSINGVKMISLAEKKGSLKSLETDSFNSAAKFSDVDPFKEQEGARESERGQVPTNDRPK